LPAGLAGWLVPAALLIATAGLVLLIPARSAPPVTALRLLLLLLTVVTGVAVGGRTAVEAANAPSSAAAAAVNPVNPDTASVERGHRMYLANCSSCHGASGLGDGPAASGMLPAPGDLHGAVPDLSDGTLAFRIGNGEVGTQMPAFAAVLTDSDRWDLVNYLRSAFRAAR
jgi:high-affinity iron transporter